MVNPIHKFIKYVSNTIKIYELRYYEAQTELPVLGMGMDGGMGHNVLNANGFYKSSHSLIWLFYM